MSTRSLVNELVGIGFQTIGDLAPNGILERATSTYDSDSGSVTKVIVQFPISQIIETRFKADELGGAVDLRTDAKLIIYQNHVAIDPITDDQIIHKGNIWNVHKLKSVPGDSVHIIHVRLA